MANTPLKRQEDIGLSPYELKFRGQHRSNEVLMTLFNIGNEEVQLETIHSIEELESFKDKDSFIWLNVDGLHNEKLMGELAGMTQIPTNHCIRYR